MSLWDSLISTGINAGIQTGLGLLASSQKPPDCNGRISGNERMKKCVPLFMQQFDELEASIPQILASGGTPQQIIQAAQHIAGVFSDDSIFDQGIGGDSAKVRDAAKQQAAQRLAAITQRVSQLAASGQTAGGYVDAAGNFVPATQSGTSPLSTPVIIAAGAILLLLLLRD